MLAVSVYLFSWRNTTQHPFLSPKPASPKPRDTLVSLSMATLALVMVPNSANMSRSLSSVTASSRFLMYRLLFCVEEARGRR